MVESRIRDAQSTAKLSEQQDIVLEGLADVDHNISNSSTVIRQDIGHVHRSIRNMGSIWLFASAAFVGLMAYQLHLLSVVPATNIRYSTAHCLREC